MKLPTLFERPLVRGVAVLGLLLVLGSMLWQSEEARDPLDARELRGPSEPDGFVVDARYLSFDQQGQLRAQIESARIEQFESRGVATMAEPRALMYDRETSIPWKLSAERGEFIEGENTARLEKRVVVRRPLAGGGEAIMATESLVLDNGRGMVYTDAPVVITDQYSVTRAVGMTAWVDDRIVELKSQVEGRYDPVTSRQQ
ncbi:LPS export ABC transporter periplasmic protein LptC [Marinobacter sp.]|uniref:LPS export ABC transporter periplasmic protein LptC n=1 Tax=Marinobacter sp. TaxID=50741 RepID=UPI00384FD890